MEDIFIGVTDRTVPVFIPDSAQTDGSGKTGLVAANLTVSYTRYETDNDVVVTDVTSSLNNLANLTAAHADWGVFEVSNTLAPDFTGWTLLTPFLLGAWYAIVYVMVTTSAASPAPIAFRLVARNDLDGVRLGLTALPNAAADAAGGLPISDAGGLDLDTKLANTNEITVARMGALTDWINGGRLDLILDIIAADTTTDIPALIATLQTFVDTEIGDLPTNAELATALGTADDAVLAAIAALNDPTVADIADAVWDEAIAGHLGAGSTGAALSAAGAAGDPWITPLPGLYVAGTAGKIIGDNINATISSRATQTSVDDLPTNAELATALGTADDAVLAQVALVKTETDKIAAVLADTNELQTDWVNGGRLDLILDARASQTSVDDLPTNAELTTALGTADDAVLTAIGDLPTNAELATALGTADDAVLAQVALVKAQTDKMTFTVTNVIDANIQHINDVAVTGDGSAGDKFDVV